MKSWDEFFLGMLAGTILLALALFACAKIDSYNTRLRDLEYQARAIERKVERSDKYCEGFQHCTIYYNDGRFRDFK